MKKIRVIVIVADQKEPVPPCGSCRQVIAEFADEYTEIVMANLNMDYKVLKIDDLLPFGFKL